MLKGWTPVLLERRWDGTAWTMSPFMMWPFSFVMKAS